LEVSKKLNHVPILSILEPMAVETRKSTGSLGFSHWKHLEALPQQLLYIESIEKNQSGHAMIETNSCFILGDACLSQPGSNGEDDACE
jgi:hypothetical protein